MRHRFIGGVLFLIVAAAISAQHPQNIAKGFAVDKAYEFNGLDQISTFNGNLNVRLPLGQSYPVSSALSYQFSLHYGGNVWAFESETDDRTEPPTHPVPVKVESAYHQIEASSAGIGWKLSLSHLGPVSIDGNGELQLDAPDGPAYSTDGTYRRIQLTPGNVVEFPDGTRYFFDSDRRLAFIKDRFENTVTINYETEADGATDWTVSDGFRSHTVDMKRLSVSVGEESYTNDVVKSVTVAAATTSGTAIYTFNYVGGDTLVGLSRQVAVEGRQDCRIGPVALAPILASITLPDGSKYEMTTDRGDALESNGSWTGKFASLDGTGAGHPGQICTSPVQVSSTPSVSGHLTKLKVPTGGSIEWTFQRYEFPSYFVESSACDEGGRDVIYCQIPVSSRDAIGVSERRQYDRDSNRLSKQVYEHSRSDATRTSTTTLTTYDGLWAGQTETAVAKSVHYYTTDYLLSHTRSDYGLPLTKDANLAPTGQTNPDSEDRYLSTKFFDGAGNLLRYGYVKYEAELVEPWQASINRRVASERTVHLDGSGNITNDLRTTFSDFDGLGHYRTVSTKNEAETFERKVTTQYNAPDPQTDPDAPLIDDRGDLTETKWIIDTYSSQTVEEKIGSTTKRSKALFLFDRQTGFLQRKRTLRTIATNTDVTLDARDLAAAFEQTGGNVTSEKYYGGDGEGQSLGTDIPTDNLISLALPSTPVTELTHVYDYGALKTSKYPSPITFSSPNRDINPNTGLPAKTTDPSGLETFLEYDAFGRLIWSKPDGVAFTEFVYTAPSVSNHASVTIQQRDGSMTGTVLSRAAVEFDDFGRVSQEKRLMPNNADSTRETVYNDRGLVASSTEWGSSGKTSYLYDALGRVTKVIAPDNKETTIAYTGQKSVTHTASVATSTTGETPVTKTETRDDLGRLVEVTEGGQPATYGYDLGDRLTSVTMTDAGTTQTRTFAYDGRGFLTSETHPESGTTSYKYDGRGRVIEKVTSKPATIKFEYDAAERLKRVLEGTTELKFFAFDRQNDGSDKSMGKMDYALSHNYIGSSDVHVTETYTYGQPGGRLSSKKTTLSTGPSFTESYIYNGLGSLTGLKYPGCVNCGTLTAPSRLVTNTYLNGFLNGVAGYTTASGISYHSSGVVSTVEHDNGPIDTQAFDAGTGMGRPLSITFSGISEPVSCPAPDATITVTPSVISRNGTAQAEVVNTPGATYAWTITGGTITAGNGTRAISFTAGCNVSSVTVNVIVTAACLQQSPGSKVVPTGPLPSATLTVDGSSTISQGDSKDIHVTLTGSSPWSVTWSDGEEPWSGSATSFDRTVTPLSTTTYTATVTDATGCSATANRTITVLLPTPTGLTATAISATQVSLNWTYSGLADSYEIERRVPGGSFVPHGTSPTTSFTGAASAN
ncbi:MAG: hypothetical protein M3P06_22385, partial [Acidobacteriota bacterium]|nr:hypothetical protein [Acidobacteriota bacterium]